MVGYWVETSERTRASGGLRAPAIPKSECSVLAFDHGFNPATTTERTLRRQTRPLGASEARNAGDVAADSPICHQGFRRKGSAQGNPCRSARLRSVHMAKL
jgi:hypothetical protein